MMPSSWDLPHKNVIQRRSRDQLSSPSFTATVPSSLSIEPTATSQSFQSESTVSQQDPTGSTASSASLSEIATPTASVSSVSSSSSPSSSAFSTSAPNSAQLVAHPSSVESTTPSTSHSHASPSTEPTVSSTSVSGTNSIANSVFTTSSSTASIPVSTPNNPAQAIAPTPVYSTYLASTSSILPAGGISTTGSEATSNTSAAPHKNVVIGVSSTFGSLLVLAAALFLLLRIAKRRRAKAEKAKEASWRYSTDSWIGTRMGESRAPTPAVAGVLSLYGFPEQTEFGAQVPLQMQQAQAAMVADYLGRYGEPVLQHPAPSFISDGESMYTAATPPGSATALIFPQHSELPYADHLSPNMSSIPVIRVTDPGAEHSRPPTSMSSLDHGPSPDPSSGDTQPNPFLIDMDTTTARSGGAGPFVPHDVPIEQSRTPAFTTVDTAQSTENPFTKMTAQRDSMSVYSQSITSTSGFFSDTVLGSRTVQGGATPVVSSSKSVASFRGDVVLPSTPVHDSDRFPDLPLTRGYEVSGRPTVSALRFKSRGPTSRTNQSTWG
ncbi:hypothetical protein BC835DRAFT_98551 [Cytidiella melzeri]|nr:hypothetical protein BC835DRAFT_98551 [Cytidiella melzeri]